MEKALPFVLSWINTRDIRSCVRVCKLWRVLANRKLFEPLQCECGREICLDTQSDHITICEKAWVECPLAQYGCWEEQFLGELNAEHWHECEDGWKVMCLQCDEYLPREEYYEHAFNIHVLKLGERVPCHLESIGCPETFKATDRAGMQHHFKRCAYFKIQCPACPRLVDRLSVQAHMDNDHRNEKVWTVGRLLLGDDPPPERIYTPNPKKKGKIGKAWAHIDHHSVMEWLAESWPDAPHTVVDAFTRHGVDGPVLYGLTASKLKDMRVPRNDRPRVLASVKRLKVSMEEMGNEEQDGGQDPMYNDAYEDPYNDDAYEDPYSDPYSYNTNRKVPTKRTPEPEDADTEMEYNDYKSPSKAPQDDTLEQQYEEPEYEEYVPPPRQKKAKPSGPAVDSAWAHIDHEAVMEWLHASWPTVPASVSDAFEREGVDGPALLLMTPAALEELSVSPQDCGRIMDGIADLRKKMALVEDENQGDYGGSRAHTPQPAASPSPAPRPPSPQPPSPLGAESTLAGGEDFVLVEAAGVPEAAMEPVKAPVPSPVHVTPSIDESSPPVAPHEPAVVPPVRSSNQQASTEDAERTQKEIQQLKELLAQAISAREEAESSLQDHVSTVQRQRVQLEEARQMMEEQRADLLKALDLGDRADEREGILKKDAAELRRLLDEEKARAATMRTELTKVQAERSTSEPEVSADALAKELAEVQAALAEVSSAKEAAVEEAARQRAAAATQQDEAARLEEALRASAEREERATAGESAALADAQRATAALAAEKARADAALADVTRAKVEQERAASALAAEQARAEAALAEAQAALAAERERGDVAEDDAAAAKAKARALEDKLAQARNDVIDARVEVEAARADAAATSAAAAAALPAEEADELARLRLQVEALRAEARAATQARDDLRKENALLARHPAPASPLRAAVASPQGPRHVPSSPSSPGDSKGLEQMLTSMQANVMRMRKAIAAEQNARTHVLDGLILQLGSRPGSPAASATPR